MRSTYAVHQSLIKTAPMNAIDRRRAILRAIRDAREAEAIRSRNHRRVALALLVLVLVAGIATLPLPIF